MAGNIIAGIVVVALIVSGVWMWWIENGPSGSNDASEDSSAEHGKK